MSLQDELNDALKDRERDLPQTITISGTDYACSASSFTRSKKLSVGGFEIEYNLSVSIRRSLFTGSLPAEQIVATFNSSSVRIERVVEEQSGAFVRLFCSSTAKGA